MLHFYIRAGRGIKLIAPMHTQCITLCSILCSTLYSTLCNSLCVHYGFHYAYTMQGQAISADRHRCHD